MIFSKDSNVVSIGTLLHSKQSFRPKESGFQIFISYEYREKFTLTPSASSSSSAFLSSMLDDVTSRLVSHSAENRFFSSPANKKKVNHNSWNRRVDHRFNKLINANPRDRDLNHFLPPVKAPSLRTECSRGVDISLCVCVCVFLYYPSTLDVSVFIRSRVLFTQGFLSRMIFSFSDDWSV